MNKNLDVLRKYLGLKKKEFHYLLIDNEIIDLYGKPLVNFIRRETKYIESNSGISRKTNYFTSDLGINVLKSKLDM
ncbi:hypothetical protein [Clostridium sp.]|uniref:hypothetical protein n=1 Tax=Clostridium sp. TaxID=1506 RepID=UPI0025C0D407|nr:hypothetical protein [Clostridium sp.]